MELSDIREQCRVEFGVPSTDTTFDDTTLDKLVNSALRSVTSLSSWPWMNVTESVTVLADTTEVVTAGDGRVHYVGITSPAQRILRRVSPSNSWKYRESTGIPALYFGVGRAIHLAPTPSEDVEIEINYDRSVESELVADVDEPLLPDRHIGLLINHVCVLMARRVGEPERERVYYSARQQAYASAIDDSDRLLESYQPNDSRRGRVWNG